MFDAIAGWLRTIAVTSHGSVKCFIYYRSNVIFAVAGANDVDHIK
jgi:hypothetical protein